MIAIYMRVSTDKQTTDGQEGAIKTWLKERRADKKAVFYRDYAMSGRSMKRPEYLRLREDCRAGGIEEVACYALDRMSRNTKEAIRMLLEFDDLKVKFTSISQPIFSSENEYVRQIVITIFAVFAQMEADFTSNRVKAGLKAAIKKGKTLGRPAKVTDEMLSEMITMRKAGKTEREIATAVGLSPGTAHKTLSKHRNLIE